MAVPKKKTSKAKSRSRRASNLDAGRSRPQPLPQLRVRKLPHVVCGTCGHYRGHQVVDVG